jgi:hypothetical protein
VASCGRISVLLSMVSVFQLKRKNDAISPELVLSISGSKITGSFKPVF